MLRIANIGFCTGRISPAAATTNTRANEIIPHPAEINFESVPSWISVRPGRKGFTKSSTMIAGRAFRALEIELYVSQY
jgi:hypothetical protein